MVCFFIVAHGTESPYKRFLGLVYLQYYVLIYHCGADRPIRGRPIIDAHRHADGKQNESINLVR